jgi:2-isopropylmalate synthase
MDRATPKAPACYPKIEIYDTTLRDGSQQEGLSLSVADKLKISVQLDLLGVDYIEAGWPGANPKDDEFFARASSELSLTNATLVAFGATRRSNTSVTTDPGIAALVHAGTPVITLVAKASLIHVTDTLNVTPDVALAMVADSVGYLVSRGKRVIVDAEHFFYGYNENPEFSMAVIDVAATSGAELVVLCDTTGGMLPQQVAPIITAVIARAQVDIGVHFHNDSGCAVANSLAAVEAGAVQVQGCINGYGERVGNTDLTSVIPDLTLKMGYPTLPPGNLSRLTAVAHHIAELVNRPPDPTQPYVGVSAFAHKAGLHASAITRRPDAYEHVDPQAVGNESRFVVSELAGRATLAARATELGLTLDPEAVTTVLDDLKRREHAGYHYEVADGSLELLLRRAANNMPDYFSTENFTVVSEHARDGIASATVQLTVAGLPLQASADGHGPVNALDRALRAALSTVFPGLVGMHLVDYRVRVLSADLATQAVTRVLIDTTDGTQTWTTIGVSENIIEASYEALVDSVVYGLIHAAGTQESICEL